MSKHKNKYPLVNESLAAGDLKWLVNEVVYLDMHKAKAGDDKDYIVLAIAVNDRDPAHDLATFIENSVHKFEDVEVSPATDSKGRYLVYVEVKRDADAFKSIDGILKDSTKLSGIDNWKFKSMGMAADVDFDADTFAANVIIDPVEYEQQHPPKVDTEQEQPENSEEQSTTESIKKRLNFLLKY